jgi:hypothetical protein
MLTLQSEINCGRQWRRIWTMETIIWLNETLTRSKKNGRKSLVKEKNRLHRLRHFFVLYFFGCAFAFVCNISILRDIECFDRPIYRCTIPDVRFCNNLLLLHNSEMNLGLDGGVQGGDPPPCSRTTLQTILKFEL